MDEELFDGGSLATAIVVTVAVGLALVLVPTLVAVPVLVSRWPSPVAAWAGVTPGSGRCRPAPSCSAAITDRASSGRSSACDDVLVIVLFVASLVASEVGARLRGNRARQH